MGRARVATIVAKAPPQVVLVARLAVLVLTATAATRARVAVLTARRLLRSILQEVSAVRAALLPVLIAVRAALLHHHLPAVASVVVRMVPSEAVLPVVEAVHAAVVAVAAVLADAGNPWTIESHRACTYGRDVTKNA